MRRSQSQQMPEISRFYGIVVGMFFMNRLQYALDRCVSQIRGRLPLGGDFCRWHLRGRGLGPHIRAGGVFARLADVSAFKQFSINPVAQPSLRDWSRRGRIPGVETPGYCRLSIRDRRKPVPSQGDLGSGSGLTGHGLGGTLPT